jgi:Holliday junction DNA helicase RuvA
VIGSLRGRLAHRSAGEVLVEVAGIGYRCIVSPATSVGLGEIGGEVLVHVHHHVREDAQALYGFPTLEERVAFEALLGAHGVGPALAVAILSVHSPAGLRRALADDDLAALCLVPGVGRKTAARLLIELKARLDVPDLDPGATAMAANGNGHGAGRPSPVDEVREALAGLGYEPEEIGRAVAGLPTDHDGDVGSLLRLALRALATRST